MGRFILSFLAGVFLTLVFSPYIFPNGFVPAVHRLALDIENEVSYLFH